MNYKEIIEKDLDGSAENYDFDKIIPRMSILPDDPKSRESLCGVDQRIKVVDTRTMPYKAICKLYMKAKNGSNYIGSGWLINKDTLLTAGHCIFDKDEDNWTTQVIVVPGKSGNLEPFGRYYAKSLAAPVGWVKNGIPRFDVGIIKLHEAVSHSDYITPALADSDRGAVCGYPADRDMGNFQYKMEDQLRKDGEVFKYLLDTYGGQSGSPLLKNLTTSIGIHNYGGCPNSASDLFEELIDFASNW